MSDKLQKALLLMLRASIPGEVVAARDSVLRLARMGPHELTSALLIGVNSRAGHGEITSQEMASRCVDWHLRNGGLSEKEAKFVNEMTNWRKPTEKQTDWLKSIYERMSKAND
jgi:hypothetical protein